jgi:hypothetical protein
VARILKHIGGDSISTGLELLIKREIERCPEGEFQAIAQMRADYERRTQAHMDEELQRADAIAAKKAQKGPSKARREFDETVAHFTTMNIGLYLQGKPLYQMGHMVAHEPEMVEAVQAHALKTFGWVEGPCPPGVVPKLLQGSVEDLVDAIQSRVRHDEALEAAAKRIGGNYYVKKISPSLNRAPKLERQTAQQVAAACGYDSKWVDLMAGAQTVVSSSAPDAPSHSLDSGQFPSPQSVDKPPLMIAEEPSF